MLLIFQNELLGFHKKISREAKKPLDLFHFIRFYPQTKLITYVILSKIILIGNGSALDIASCDGPVRFQRILNPILMETDDGSTTNEDTDEPTVDVVSDATDNESQISGKVLIYKSHGELSLLVRPRIQCVFYPILTKKCKLVLRQFLNFPLLC